MTASASLAQSDAPTPLRSGAWSPAEDAILRENYQKLGAEKTAAILGRSVCSTHHRSQRLKVFTHARWTKADDRKMSMLWGEIGVAAVAKAMNRTEDSVYFHAKKIGLSRGLQPGMEYLRNAATRTGYSPQALARILEWAGVHPQRTMSRITKGAAYRWRMVDPEEVDDAISRWMESEVLNDAARRRGIEGGTLIRLLKASGLELPPRPGNRGWWRIPTATIDKAIAQKDGRESLFEASARVRLTRGTLARLLDAAGVKRYIGKCWYVDKATVDRVIAEAEKVRPKIAAARRARR
jgi:hypothetical protein